MYGHTVQPALGEQGRAGRIWSARLTRQALPLLAAVVLALATILPIGALLVRSLFNRDGTFAGIDNFVRYATEPGLAIAAWNSIMLSGSATVLTILIAYPLAYGLNRSCMPFRGLFRAIVMLPLLAPSLLPPIGLIYLFGTQGVLRTYIDCSELIPAFAFAIALLWLPIGAVFVILSAALAAVGYVAWRHLPKSL